MPINDLKALANRYLSSTRGVARIFDALEQRTKGGKYKEPEDRAVSEIKKLVAHVRGTLDSLGNESRHREIVYLNEDGQKVLNLVTHAFSCITDLEMLVNLSFAESDQFDGRDYCTWLGYTVLGGDVEKGPRRCVYVVKAYLRNESDSIHIHVMHKAHE
jgi:hypothetical protein